MSDRSTPEGNAPVRSEGDPPPTAAPSQLPLGEILERLAADLDAGTETLAAELGVDHEVLLRDLVDRARRSPPAILAPEKRRWGAFDVVVGVALALLLTLAARAIWILRSPEPPEESPIESSLGGGPASLVAGDLAGRTLIALPVDLPSYTLLGDLPTRLSAAVVPGPPAEGAALRPVHRLDDLLVLRAEATDHGVALLVAVPEAEVPALLEALPGATVHLLRPPADDEAATPRKDPASATP